ncbi:metallopeptidase family protein [Streptomyces sp. TRM 70361]|uniref:metallopeptidase family protein n=1 Tax=Streptomyces sp. TRM 70361 TaxID=3116553 RepID=UPI002E7B2385|nr:metallopeptidase family protein [Streptomyces sp. TRM 70361]MEE1943371.1 metallopeptidase family protein [Streptomyces sp. TRM 70361]
MSNPVPPHRPDPRPRRRDRHGRGMRGPVAPPQVPLAVSRAEVFDDLVRDSAERLEKQWPQLAGVEFVVREVPPVRLPRPDGDRFGGPAGRPPGDGPDGWGGGWADGDGSVPLGRHETARDSRPDRVVVYRRPVELRSRTRDDRARLVHEVVVEQVAELLGLAPESIDPRYGQD